MFGKIKKIFSGNSPVEIDEEAIEDEDLSSIENPNFITEPEKIFKLLSELEAASPLCSVQIEDSSKTYSSSILGLNFDKNLILLDELFPKEGNGQLQSKKSLKFFALHKGIHLSFFLNEVEIGISRGLSYYKAVIPDRIYYPQRRRAHRIDIDAIRIPFKGVTKTTEISVSGYLFDLSRGGAGINLPVNKARILRGDILKSCQIYFEDYTMDFELEVRFVKQATAGASKMQIGGLFDKISAKSEIKLSYFISSLERVEIRRQKS